MSTNHHSRFAFTKKALLAIPLDDHRRTFTDSKCPRLQIRIGKRRVFSWYGRADKRPRRIKIGSFPDISIEQARKIAERISGQLASGEDPTAPSNALTLGEVWTRLLIKLKGHKRTWHLDQRRYDRHLRQWHNRTLKAITPGDVESLHLKLGTTTPVEANQVVKLLRRTYRYAKRTCGYDGRNPCGDVTLFTEHSRERFLQPSEAPVFFRELDTDPDEDFRDYVYLLLYTGARSGNVRAMRWSDLDLATAIWSIPGESTKTAATYTVALSADAQAILTRRKAKSRGQWVFTAKRGRGSMRLPKYQWEALLQRCQFRQRLTPHDLRRTLGSWMASAGASLPQIGKQLGHKDQRSTQIYARLTLDAVRDSVAKATAALQLAGNGKAVQS